MMPYSKALEGKRVLIIEDDYYQSRDEAKNVELAGGTVVACTADAIEACVLIDRGNIDCALVDINLGNGPAFQTARALRNHGIPFIFMTGYDAAIVPEDLRDAVLIQKPFNHGTLLTALTHLS